MLLNKSQRMNKEIEELASYVSVSTYRIWQTATHIMELIEKTSIPESVFYTAARAANRNPFHDFGHQIVTANGIYDIAIESGFSKPEAAEMVYFAIFHDGGHEGYVQVDDEIRAFLRMKEASTAPMVRIFTERPFKEFMTIGRDVIMATAFSQHGKMTGLCERMMQDADLSHIGRGPEYWLYASIGLVDEFNRDLPVKLTPYEFITISQKNFVNHLLDTGKGKVWLTDAAQKIFRDPVEDVEILRNYSDAVINFAYNYRKKDITFAEFKSNISTLN
jgi:hypothetical protein